MTFAAAFSLSAADSIPLSRYGIRPDTGKDMSAKFSSALNKIRKQTGGHDVTLTLAPGRYDFYPEKAEKQTYFISNHDQPNPKSVGINLTGWQNLTIEGEGVELIFHGQMLPLAVTHCSGVNISGVSIDFAEPHITQVSIEQSGDEGTTFTVAPWSHVRVASNGKMEAYGHGWTNQPQGGIPFDPETRHVLYRTGDLWCPTDSTVDLGNGRFLAPKWKDARLVPGTVVTMRSWGRPAPGIFLSQDTATTLTDVTVHYAEGMGLLAQVCHDITLQGFRVALRGDSDPRYFTTQADATHFSGCSGKISSVGGLYEGMMDDAINVHGTYLRVSGRPDANTVTARYMHNQSYGFHWASPGDSVQIVRSATMDLLPGVWHIAAITPVDQPTVDGAKEFRITFTEPLPAEVSEKEGFGLENLSLCPEVYFADNLIRNNRARGSLFSTPRHTLVERNTFDHTSGTAILLCGDCNGWYETGACRDVTIRQNRFINALTCLYQFTEAVISIYPEIPQLDAQQTYFHSGILIEDNEFITFDRPILFAKSVNGLTFRRNTIEHNNDYKPFHSNQDQIRLLRATGVSIQP